MRYLIIVALASLSWLSGSEDAEAQLRPRQVQQVVSQRLPQVRQCHQASLQRGAAPSTFRLTVRMTILPSGRIKKVEIANASTSPALLQCVRQALSTMRFPASARQTRISYPFVFAPPS